jgi:DNA-binding MarR family transcriptional regulator
MREAGAVSLATLSALRVVDRHRGTCRVQEVRAELRITVGAASKLVDRLERDGLAVRHPHPDDRRSSLVELTGTGAEALAAATDVVERALAEHLHDEPGLAATTEVLRRLDARLLTAEVTR